MQFKKQQREQLSSSWGPNSWFFQELGSPARGIIEHAYSLTPCKPRIRSLSQEYLTLAISIFARKIGAEKSHVVHALLTGSLASLLAAIGRKEGVQFSAETVREAWQDSFREVSLD